MFEHLGKVLVDFPGAVNQTQCFTHTINLCAKSVLKHFDLPKKNDMSWTESTTSSFQSSKSKVPQISPMIRPTYDPEKQGTRAKLSGDLIPCDQNRSKSPDISRALTRDKSRDPICFG